MGGNRVGMLCKALEMSALMCLIVFHQTGEVTLSFYVHMSAEYFAAFRYAFFAATAAKSSKVCGYSMSDTGLQAGQHDEAGVPYSSPLQRDTKVDVRRSCDCLDQRYDHVAHIEPIGAIEQIDGRLSS